MFGLFNLENCETVEHQHFYSTLRLLCPTEYVIATTTANTDDADTKENVWMILEGKKARSKELVLENASKKKRFLWWVLRVL